MDRILHINIFVLLFIFSMYSLRAQSSLENKRDEIKKSPVTNIAGFISQSTVTKSADSVIVSNYIIPNSENISTIEIDKNKPSTKIYSIPTGENIMFDYSQMPHDVQLKIDSNKSEGKPLFDGILKGYTTQCKSCITYGDTKNAISFLSDINGYVDFELESPGIIKIIVLCSFDPDILDDLIEKEKINMNLIDEFYFLNK